MLIRRNWSPTKDIHVGAKKAIISDSNARSELKESITDAIDFLPPPNLFDMKEAGDISRSARFSGMTRNMSPTCRDYFS